MKTYKVLSVGKNLPDCEITNFRSTLSFTDFDILVIDPVVVAESFPNAKLGPDNRYHLNQNDSDSMYATIIRRKAEINALLKAGKIIVSFLTPPRFFVFSMNHNQIQDNYSWLPDPYHYGVFSRLVNGEGKRLKLTNKENLFAQYFYAFKEQLSFTAYIDMPHQDFPFDVFIFNSVDHIVGFSINESQGKMVFLPEFPDKDDSKEKFVGVLTQIASKHFGQYVKSDEPVWLKDYSVPGIEKFNQLLLENEIEISKLEARKVQIITDRNTLDDFKFLLYEKGLSLQNKVMHSLGILGFRVETKKIENTDLDVVLESEEGRAIAEVEGKDDSAINKDKINQLLGAINEDAESQGTFAKGILIGNHYRLREISKREVPFTQAVFNLAKQYHYALMTTIDLYNAIIYALEHPEDEDYKIACRKAIFEADGTLVTFPKKE